MMIHRRSRKTELVMHDIAELEWLINFIDRDETESESEQVAVFADVVDKATKYGVDPDDLCDKFGINRSTVSRWKNMKSAPQPYVRPLVLNEIASLLNAIVAEKQKAARLMTDETVSA